MVWGGISKRGPTQLVIFVNTMTSEFYQEEILRKAYMPFVASRFPEGGAELMQDNDPKHTSRSTQAFMEEHGINWWRTPAESPDINPIERVWNAMKVYVSVEIQPTSQADLVHGALQFWATLTPEICTRYIDKIYDVLPAIVEANGAATRY